MSERRCFNCGAPATHHLRTVAGEDSPLVACEYHTGIAIAAGVYGSGPTWKAPTPIAEGGPNV